MLPSRFVIGMGPVGLMVLGAGVVSGQATSTGSGQDYPNKPIRFITTPAGGGGDFTSRLIAEGISGPLGQPVIVENRANSLIGEIVAKAPPDGYTLIVAGDSLRIFPLLQKAPYDVVRDFSPITLVTREVRVLAVHPSLPVKSVKELIALAKARPGELNYGSTAAGGPSQLSAELFKSMAGVNIVRISYKGQGPALTALIGGEVQLMFTEAGGVTPHTKSGRLRALAVTTAEPSELVPGLPTVAASGLPGFQSVSTTSILAPAKTPDAIVKRLNQEIVRVLNRPDVKQKFFNAGAEVVGNSPEELAAFIKSDNAVLAKVIKDAGIKVD